MGKGMRRRSRPRQTLPTIPEGHEELLAALELVEFYRQMSQSAEPQEHEQVERQQQQQQQQAELEGNYDDDCDQYIDDDYYHPSFIASVSSPQSPSSLTLFLESVGKPVDVSNLVSLDLLEQQQETRTIQSTETRPIDEYELHRPLVVEEEAIYPSLGNVEAIEDLDDVDKVFEEYEMRREQNRSQSPTNNFSPVESPLPRCFPEERRSQPLSDDTNTYTDSYSPRTFQDPLQDPAQPAHHCYSPEHMPAPPAMDRCCSSPCPSSSSSSSSSSQGLERSIEISPGVSKTLRGADETSRAIETGFFEHQQCLCCDIELVYVADADFVLCPKCRVVSPALMSPTMPTTCSPSYGGCYSSSDQRVFSTHPNHQFSKPRPMTFHGSAAGGVGLGLLVGMLQRV